MRIHISNLNGYIKESTAQIAQNMVATVGNELGFIELGVFGYPMKEDTINELYARLDGMLASVRKEDVIILQVPSWNGIRFDHHFISRIKEYEFKLILFVHDIVPLMFATNADYMPFQIEILNMADALILPTENMKNRLLAEGLQVENIVIQQIWDYPLSLDLPIPSLKRDIYFLGTAEKFQFINDWQFSTPLKVFDSSTYITQTEEYVIPLGWQDDMTFSRMLSQGGFGLLWGADDYWTEYMTMNLSYKLSAYLSSGVPVIFKNGLSNQKLLEEKGIGIAVDSLEEAVEIVQTMSEATYNQYAANVASFNQLLRNGYFTRKAMIDVIHTIF